MSNFQKSNQQLKNNQVKATSKRSRNFQEFKNIKASDLEMISSLIDNSIASYQGSSSRNVDFKKLNITIIVNKITKNNRSLTIIDNAVGMDTKTLNSIINIEQQQTKKDHQFEVDLKHFAFFFGDAIDIITKKAKVKKYNYVKIDLKKLAENNDETTIYQIKHNNDLEVKDNLEIFQDYNYSGTAFKISYLHKGKLSKHTLMNKMPEFLNKKYIKYLEKGMRINIIYKEKDQIKQLIKITPTHMHVSSDGQESSFVIKSFGYKLYKGWWMWWWAF